MPSIRHFLIIFAAPEKVYHAVTEQDGLAGWWTAETVAKSEKGHINEFKFGDRYHNKMRVDELISNRRVAWECLRGDKEWVGTNITFDLEEKDGKTVLRFAHSGWKDETDFFASCNFNWGYYMQSLKSYCETGQGAPYREE
jgi:uncharacterized protein YndB with AHSA1/START domain